MGKYDIFISCCREDTLIAQQIYKRLEDSDLICFLALNPTIADFAEAMQSAIINSKNVIFIYGDNSEDSIYQRRELDLALESGKKVISLDISTCKNGVIHSILRKKTVCYTSIDNICNNIQNEISYIKKGNKVRISPGKTYEGDNRPSYKAGKKRCILLITIVLLIICLLFTLYYACSPRFTGSKDSSIPPEYSSPIEYIPIMNTASPIKDRSRKTANQSENITDSIYPSEILDSDTAYISFKENETEETIITSTSQSSDWMSRIWINRCISALFGILLGIILVLIIKVSRKKRDNIKLSSDVNVSVSIDGCPLAKIEAGNVFSTRLEKGEYLIDFETNDDVHNRIIQKIVDNNTHVIFSEFFNKQEIKFKCFIAGSLALSVERNALIAVVSKMHNRWETERFRISSYTFEDFNRDVVPGGQQKLYDTFIENDADWCVFIISNGIGEKTLNEYRVAMNSLRKNGYPKILFLASSEPARDETLSAIKKEIIDANQYWNSYNNIEHMQSIFRDCIEWDVTLLSKSRKMAASDRLE